MRRCLLERMAEVTRAALDPLLAFAAPAILPPATPAQAHSKVEWLLGYTKAEMSYQKALEVLGVSEAVVDEERSRRLGELGLTSWASTAAAAVGHDVEDTCGGFFGKRRGAAAQDNAILGITLTGDEAFAATNVSRSDIAPRLSRSLPWDSRWV